MDKGLSPLQQGQSEFCGLSSNTRKHPVLGFDPPCLTHCETERPSLTEIWLSFSFSFFLLFQTTLCRIFSQPQITQVVTDKWRVHDVKSCHYFRVFKHHTVTPQHGPLSHVLPLQSREVEWPVKRCWSEGWMESKSWVPLVMPENPFKTWPS